jgi:hypothetical protein
MASEANDRTESIVEQGNDDQQFEEFVEFAREHPLEDDSRWTRRDGLRNGAAALSGLVLAGAVFPGAAAETPAEKFTRDLTGFTVSTHAPANSWSSPGERNRSSPSAR